MADELKTSDQVRALFQEYPEIGDKIGRLGKDIDTLNQLNKTAGGTDDAVAQQYHQQVDLGGEALSELVTLLQDVSDGVGTAGTDATSILARGESDAQTLADTWNKES
jgi:hypothetical protein